MAGRDSRIAMVRLGVDSRAYAQGLRTAEKQTQTWGSRVKGHISNSLRGAFGGLGGITGLAGAAGFGAMAREVKQFNDRLVRLQISSNKTRGDMMKFNADIQRVAVTTGASQDDLLAGAQKFQELTGNLDQYTAAMESFAKVQVATGATMDDLATAAAALTQNLGVKPEQILNTFDTLTAQGKAGAVELRDLAGELAGVTGQFALFNEVGPKGAAQLGAWFQVLRKGAPSAAEATTQLEGLMTAVRKEHKDLKAKFGINVWADAAKTQLRGLDEITDEILAKIPLAKWGEVFGRKEATNALITYRNNRDEFRKLITAGGDGKMIMKDFATASDSVAGKLGKAQARLKEAFNTALIDNLDAIVVAFEAMVSALKWIVAHPEAVAAVALLWKGGGFASTLGALGQGKGGAGTAAGMAAAGVGGGSRMARFTGAAGGVMQGAGVGVAVASTVGRELGTVAQGAIVAGNALSTLHPALMAAAVAVNGIAVAFALATEGIERRERQMVSRTLDTYFLERASEVGIGANGVDMGARVAGRVTERQRSGARSILAEANAQGFVKDGELDDAAMSKFVNSQKGWSKEEKNRAKAAFRAAVRVSKLDAEAQTKFPEQVSTGPLFDEAAAMGGPGAMEPQPAGISPRQVVDLVVRVLPTEGISAVVEKDKRHRRGSR